MAGGLGLGGRIARQANSSRRGPDRAVDTQRGNSLLIEAQFAQYVIGVLT